MVIRSYRRVFDIERRIYRVDRFRLNPSGVPVRGVLYFLALLLAALLVGRLPLLGDLLSALPWYVRTLLLPGCSAALLSVIRIEGRPFHLSARALLRHGLGPRHIAGVSPVPAPGGRWYPDPILLLPDGSDSRMRRMRYSGPGAVLVAVEHERESRASERGGVAIGRVGRRPALALRATSGGGPLQSRQVIAIADGVRLFVHEHVEAAR
jgi:hypothetical protein